MTRLLSFLSLLLPWMVFAHAIVFILFWLTNSLFYTSSNDYLADMLGKRMDYVSLLLWVSALIAAWSCLRGILILLRISHNLSVLTAWVYGIISLVYVIFFYASFYLLFSESPVQLVRIGQLIGYYRIILDSLLLLVLALLAGFGLRSYLHQRVGGQVHWSLWVGVVVVYLILWVLPLIFMPGSVVRGSLPKKPLLIAHRGASMLAPENTIASANLATRIGVYGLETDVHVSLDGQLFLMHDDTFDRTTDIASVFPGRQDEPVENFTLAEIRQLNAGKWFVEQDPYHTIRRGLVTPEQVQEYLHQTVPLLADWLEIVRANHLDFRFDLKQPPAGHPYADSFFELALSEIHRAGIDPMVWFLVDQEQLQTLRTIAPDMIPTYSADYHSLPPVANLTSLGYRIVNVEYGIRPWWIKQYQAAGIWVDVYTVDEPWQFSRLWLLGVNSVTTSNAGVMSTLTHPIFALTLGQYLLAWGMVGLAGWGLLAGLVVPIARRRP